MRFVLAIVSFLLAAVLIGYGIAQRTILAEPDEVSLSTTVESDAAVTVIDGTTLNAFVGNQTLNVSGSDEVFAAYGRTADVLAWIGDTEYNAVSFDEETGELTSELVPGEATEVPDPNGSDLWLDDYVKDDSLTLTVKVPDSISFIIVSDGVAPAPNRLSLTWPVDTSTPWAGPLIVGGAVALLLGLGFLLWALHHMRSSRGPRRKQPKMPKVPRKALPKKAGRKAVESPKSNRRAVRGMIAVPVVLAGALVLSGCGAQYWPDLDGAPSTPSPSASGAPEAAELDPPAVTTRQVERIIARIVAVAADADAAKDAALIATRFDGAALELRLASYQIQAGDPTIGGLPAIPDGEVSVVLPQQTDTWPRTVLTVIENPDDDTVPPVALYLEQADPRSDYKVAYAITMEPSAVLPAVAPANVGASRLATDTGVLKMTPQEVALAYGEILEQDVDSPSFLEFEAEGDTLRTAVGLAKKNELRASLPATASITFGHEIGAAEPIALATNDAGAIVAVNLNEITTVAPTEAGAAVNPTGSVKALSGVAVSTKGVMATYGDQLLFYVPPAGSDAKIVLLGYSQGLVKATEIG